MNCALIFAGGAGQRMNSKTKPKQFLELNGKPIVVHTIELFDQHPQIDAIVVVCIEGWTDYMFSLVERYRLNKVKWIVLGGKTAHLSIFNGLHALHEAKIREDSLVLIHDGVRPLIDTQTISDNIECAGLYGNAITVSPAIETIIRVSPDNEVQSILDRKSCQMARAPQTFRLGDIWKAHLKAKEQGMEDVIDSATLMDSFGMKLHTVQGPYENIKITTPSDYYMLRAFSEAREYSQIWR